MLITLMAQPATRLVVVPTSFSPLPTKSTPVSSIGGSLRPSPGSCSTRSGGTALRTGSTCATATGSTTRLAATTCIADCTPRVTASRCAQSSTIRARGWPETAPPAEDIYEKEPPLREFDRGGIRAHFTGGRDRRRLV